MKTRTALETELEVANKRIEVLHNELHEAYMDIQRLQRENYALQIDNDIITSALRTISTRKSAEMVNRIMAYETEPINSDKSLAELLEYGFYDLP